MTIVHLLVPLIFDRCFLWVVTSGLMEIRKTFITLSKSQVSKNYSPLGQTSNLLENVANKKDLVSLINQ